jgi:tetrahydromethanopterin S-methyltransferase subunit B
MAKKTLPSKTPSKSVRTVNGEREIQIIVNGMPAYISEKDFYQIVNDDLRELKANGESMQNALLDIPEQFSKLNKKIDDLKISLDCNKAELETIKTIMPKKITTWIKEKATTADSFVKVAKAIALILLILAALLNVPVIGPFLKSILGVK